MTIDIPHIFSSLVANAIIVATISKLRIGTMMAFRCHLFLETLFVGHRISCLKHDMFIHFDIVHVHAIDCVIIMANSIAHSCSGMQHESRISEFTQVLQPNFNLKSCSIQATTPIISSLELLVLRECQLKLKQPHLAGQEQLARCMCAICWQSQEI